MALTNNTSVRLTILKTMQAIFTAMRAELPAEDPMGFEFSTVALGPLADFDQRKRLSLGVHVGQERTAYKFEFAYAELDVNLEIRLTVNRDDPAPGDLLEQVITAVQRTVMANRQWGGIAIDTKIIGTEVDLLTYFDRSAMASLVCRVQYRYSYTDPRSPKTRN